jgi:hypothetical protein
VDLMDFDLSDGGTHLLMFNLAFCLSRTSLSGELMAGNYYASRLVEAFLGSGTGDLHDRQWTGT